MAENWNSRALIAWIAQASSSRKNVDSLTGLEFENATAPGQTLGAETSKAITRVRRAIGIRFQAMGEDAP